MTVTDEDPRPARMCCASWGRLTDEQRAAWPWQALHELCHGRVPFSRGHYAEVARLSVREAWNHLEDAKRDGWWVPSHGQCLGQLRRKR